MVLLGVLHVSQTLKTSRNIVAHSAITKIAKYKPHIKAVPCAQHVLVINVVRHLFSDFSLISCRLCRTGTKKQKTSFRSTSAMSSR